MTRARRCINSRLGSGAGQRIFCTHRRWKMERADRLLRDLHVRGAGRFHRSGRFREHDPKLQNDSFANRQQSNTFYTEEGLRKRVRVERRRSGSVPNRSQKQHHTQPSSSCTSQPGKILPIHFRVAKNVSRRPPFGPSGWWRAASSEGCLPIVDKIKIKTKSKTKHEMKF